MVIGFKYILQIGILSFYFVLFLGTFSYDSSENGMNLFIKINGNEIFRSGNDSYTNCKILAQGDQDNKKKER